MTTIAATARGAAKPAANPNKALDLRDALVDLFERHNQSGRSDLTVIPATFLRVTVSR